MSDNKFTQFLKENPRMIGVLFTMMVFLSTTGSAMANAATSNAGP